MKLNPPLIITPRLMAGLQIGSAFISIEAGPRESSGRTAYRAFIDLPDHTEHEITDQRSGCGGGSVTEGLSSLLSFLGAAAESYRYEQHTGRAGENADLFPRPVVEWASENSDELSMLQYEIEEGQS